MELSAPETRVLGCLLEKQRTTPDVYPLSLNALRLACNQSTNRDPVVDYDDAVIRDALHRLERRGFTRLASGAGSRAPKYRHLLAEALPMGDGRAGGDVRADAARPADAGRAQAAQRAHAPVRRPRRTCTRRSPRLIERGLVARLERRPGQKEERYAQLLEDARRGASEPADGAGAERAERRQTRARRDGHEPAATERVARRRDLHERVARLEREVAELRAAMRRSLPREHAAVSHAAPAARRLLRRRHRRGHPAGARRRARVVPLAVRAAARARLPLDRDRGDAGGPARASARAACSSRACCSSRASRSIFILLGTERDGDRLDAQRPQTDARAGRRRA